MLHRVSRLTLTASVAVTGLVLSLVPNVTSAVTVRTVALSGQSAPGSGQNYGSNFGTPVLNDAGHTAFSATPISSHEGVWSEGSGSLALAARSGDLAPGTDRNYSDFSSLVLNDAGQIAFWAGLQGGGSGIWVNRTGIVTLVARQGSQATDMPAGVVYGNFFLSTVLNNAGQTAFSSSLGGSGVNLTNRWGIWSEGAGSLAAVIRTGEQAPGVPGASIKEPASGRSFATPVLNDTGQTVFIGRLAGIGVDETNGTGIWSGDDGNLAMVMRAGTQAPGTPAGVSFANFTISLSLSDPPALDSSGRTAFVALLTGNGVDSTNNAGIFSEGSGNLALVARLGSQAPGLPSGVNFGGDFGAISFQLPVVMNDAGQTAFGVRLTGRDVDGSNNSSIWSEGTGSLALVARRGSQAPGAPTGITFDGFGFRSIVLNNAGQTAFLAELIGSGVDDSNNDGIWATDQSGVLQLIAREGNLLEVSPGEFRTISSLRFIGGTGNSDGRPSGFNNLGQVAFHARFTDNSAGIFVSNLVAIPEPSALMLASLALLAICYYATAALSQKHPRRHTKPLRQ